MNNENVDKLDSTKGLPTFVVVLLSIIAAIAIAVPTTVFAYLYSNDEAVNDLSITDPEPVAFAVYSDTDNSLNFYKRTTVPTQGTTWDDGRGVEREVTGVYRGIETDTYSFNTNKYGSRYQPWYSNASKIKSVTFVDDGITPDSTAYWFYLMGNTSFTKINNLDKLDTSNVTTMEDMFEGCENLSALDLSNFDTSNVTDMSYMFSGCTSLSELDVSNFDTSNVTNMMAMFNECYSLTSLDLSNWDTSNVNTMQGMFQDSWEITSIGDTSNWNTSNVTDMYNMFADCVELKELHVYSWDTSKVTDMAHMFWGCSNLEELDLSNWDTSKVEDMGHIFYYCSELTELDLSNWDTSKVTNMGGMFQTCLALKTIYVDSAWSTASITSSNSMFHGCESLVGGLGTTYSFSNPTDKTYAHIDGGTSNPGYFTPKINIQFSGKTEPQLYKYGIEAPEAIEGFQGWSYTTTSGVEHTFMPGDIVTYDADCIESMMLYPWGEVSGYKVTFDANGGTFEGGKTTNEVVYSEPTEETITKYSYSPNWADDENGSKTAGYGNNQAVTDVVTIPGAEKLTVTLTYCTESTSYDWVCLYKDGITPSASNYASSVTGGKIGGTTQKTETFEIEGDTVQIFFRSDGSQCNYYGYKAVVEAVVGEPQEIISGSYIEPSNSDCEFLGWSIHNGAIEAEYQSLDDVEITEYMTLYAVWSSSDIAGYTVYSETDNSLNFYKRTFIPTVGSTFDNGDGVNRVVTGVYEGIETDTYDGRKNKYDTYFQPWSNYTKFIESVTFVDDGITPISTSYWFYGMNNASFTSINNLDKLNTSNVVDMSYMFFNCSKLTSLDVTNFDTSNVADMTTMFQYCSSLTELDVSNFDTSQVVVMNSMFSACRLLTSLDLSDWKIGNAENVSYMFTQCSSLTELNLNGWDTSKVTNMSYMFFDCTSLTELGISDWNTSNVTDMNNMFDFCSTLTELDLSSFDTSSVENMEGMFGWCSKLTTIYVSDKWSTNSVSSSGFMFSSCSKLVGGDGTVFNSSKVDASMAHIDGGTSNPGYLTEKPKVAFAIHSDTDKSLNFYKRTSVPEVGDVIDGNTVTEIYTGFENEKYEWDSSALKTSAPWYALQSFTWTRYSDIATVTFVDEGIQPISTAYWFYGFDALTAINGLDKLDTSKVEDMSQMFGNCSKLPKLDVSSFDTSNVTSMSNMFYTCESLRNLDLSNFDTSSVENMYGLFYGCKNLTEITGLDNFDTSNVTTMSYMFSSRYTNINMSFTRLDLSNWNTSKVTTMSCMFQRCTSLKDVDVSSFDTSNVTNMSYMFADCRSLTELDVSNFDTSNVTTMTSMFGTWSQGTTAFEYGCSNLSKLDLSSFDTSNVTNMAGMFQKCSSLVEIDGLENWNISKVTSLYSLFKGCKSLTDLEPISKWDVSNVTNMSYLFEYCSSLTDLEPISKWDVSNVTNMSCLFFRCSSLTNLEPISNWNTFNVENMSSIFYNCKSLSNLEPISKWDVSNVTNMSTMFYECTSLVNVDLSNWDTGNVTTLSSIFAHCESLCTLTISSWDVSNVTTLYQAFEYCYNLTSLDLSSWNTSNVTTMAYMFYDCYDLTDIGDVSSWDTSSVTTMLSMFASCNLLEVDCSSWNVAKVTVNKDFKSLASGVIAPNWVN